MGYVAKSLTVFYFVSVFQFSFGQTVYLDEDQSAPNSEFHQNLLGEWYNCSKEYQPFLFDADSTKLTLVRSIEPINCSEPNDHFFSLSFTRFMQENECSFYGYSGDIAGGGVINFEVDPISQMIYFGSKEIFVYNIITLTENELVLSFNRERTEALKLNSE